MELGLDLNEYGRKIKRDIEVVNITMNMTMSRKKETQNFGTRVRLMLKGFLLKCQVM